MSGNRSAITATELDFNALLEQWGQKTPDGKTIFDQSIEKEQFSVVSFSRSILDSSFILEQNRERARKYLRLMSDLLDRGANPNNVLISLGYRGYIADAPISMVIARHLHSDTTQQYLQLLIKCMKLGVDTARLLQHLQIITKEEHWTLGHTLARYCDDATTQQYLTFLSDLMKNDVNPTAILNLLQIISIGGLTLGYHIAHRHDAACMQLYILLLIQCAKLGCSSENLRGLLVEQLSKEQPMMSVRDVLLQQHDPATLYVLLLFQSGILIDEDYKLFAEYKDDVEKYIDTLPDRHEAWKNALDQTHPLGKFFWYQRNWLVPPSLLHGTLRKMLEKFIAVATSADAEYLLQLIKNILTNNRSKRSLSFADNQNLIISMLKKALLNSEMEIKNKIRELLQFKVANTSYRVLEELIFDKCDQECRNMLVALKSEAIAAATPPPEELMPVYMQTVKQQDDRQQTLVDTQPLIYPQLQPVPPQPLFTTTQVMPTADATTCTFIPTSEYVTPMPGVLYLPPFPHEYTEESNAIFLNQLFAGNPIFQQALQGLPFIPLITLPVFPQEQTQESVIAFLDQLFAFNPLLHQAWMGAPLTSIEFVDYSNMALVSESTQQYMQQTFIPEIQQTAIAESVSPPVPTVEPIDNLEKESVERDKLKIPPTSSVTNVSLFSTRASIPATGTSPSAQPHKDPTMTECIAELKGMHPPTREKKKSSEDARQKVRVPNF